MCECVVSTYVCVCVVSRYVCDINDTCALGSRPKLLFYEAGTKKDGAHTCFELRRSEAQIFFCLRGEAYIFR